MSIAAREAELLAWLEEQYEPMLGLLLDVANIDSGSFEAADAARAGSLPAASRG